MKFESNTGQRKRTNGRNGAGSVRAKSNGGHEGKNGSNFVFWEAARDESAQPYDIIILHSLQKIIRAIDLYSRKLRDTYGLTVPQLICLSAIVRNRRLTAIELARFAHISPSALVGILDRLELKRLIRRERNLSDRREIFISITPTGRKTVSHAPSPLQDSLADRLHKLPVREREHLASSLNRVVDLMEGDYIEATPLIVLDRRKSVGINSHHSGGNGRGMRKID